MEEKREKKMKENTERNREKIMKENRGKEWNAARLEKMDCVTETSSDCLDNFFVINFLSTD